MGTKLGCGEGGCGACTVMVSMRGLCGSGPVRHIAVNACLAPLCSIDGMAITTVEGIGSVEAGLHPCQVGLGIYWPGVYTTVGHVLIASGNDCISGF